MRLQQSVVLPHEAPKLKNYQQPLRNERVKQIKDTDR